MKRFLPFLIAFLLVAAPVFAVDKDLILEWDYDEAEFQLLDGFRLYTSTTSGQYSTPLAEILKENLQPTGAGTVTSSQDVTLTVPDNAVTTFYFVASAYNANGESDMSNEASITFDYENPPPVADLAGVFNDTTNTIDFTWTYDTTWLDRISYWGLYVSDTAVGPFSSIASIPYDPAMTEPYSVSQDVNVPPGSSATYYYVIVAHRGTDNNSAFSANSNVVQVDIRKMPPNAPFSLKVRIR